ncbi:MAG: alcohol dehydrogenase catalytic domain-containing protein [Bacillota bacterium]|nr:alcohol dehydrogenase catalytic domain-containing protein [Bacillota bacterium]
MKAVMLVKDFNPETGELGEVDCLEVPTPKLVRDDDVLIKITYASICGSDPNVLKGLFPDRAPCPIGHEMAGTIADLGPDAKKLGWQVGDRVTGNFFQSCGACEYCHNNMGQFCPNAVGKVGAQAEYIVWSTSQLYRLPNTVDLLTGTLAEPFNIALHAIETADMKLGARVAISGGGGIGLMLIQLARLAGASEVTLLEPVQGKRDLALELGTDHTIDPVGGDALAETAEITGGRGFNLILETSGNTGAAETALQIAAKQGHVVYFAMYPQDYELPVNLFKHCYHNELRIQGMFLGQYSFARSVAMLPRVNLKPLIDKIYPLEECKQAYADQMSGKYAKLVFDCSA